MSLLVQLDKNFLLTLTSTPPSVDERDRIKQITTALVYDMVQ